MEIVQFLLVLAVLVVAVTVVSAPFRRPREPDDDDFPDLGALEAAREAKYREIREAELDLRTGKLSRKDWEAIDRQLRAEAVEVLHALDHARRDQTTS